MSKYEKLKKELYKKKINFKGYPHRRHRKNKHNKPTLKKTKLNNIEKQETNNSIKDIEH